MEHSTAWRIANRFASLAPQQRREFLQKMQEQGVSFGQLPIPVTASEDEPCELSYAQQRQWFMWQLDPQGAAYHIPAALRLHGALNVHALQQSFDALLARHHSLRTVFVEHDGQVLQQLKTCRSELAREAVCLDDCGAAFASELAKSPSRTIKTREPDRCPYPIPSAKALPEAGKPTTARN